MGHSPKEIMKKTPAQMAKQRNHHSLVDHENFAHLLPLLPTIKLMIIARKNNHIQYNHTAKRVSQSQYIIIIQSIIFSSSNIHTTTKHVTTFQAIHYDTTRLIRIRITQSDSTNACTCCGYLCSPPSCSTLSYVLQVLR